MTRKELKLVLEKHLKWLRGEPEGERANLSGAYLTRANLTGAYLTGAYLSGAYLTRANLTGAYLTGAYLTGAYLTGANLTRANLTGANLSGANLDGANLTGTTLPPFQIVPEEGDFIGYKKVDTGVIKLLIPAAAKRTSSLVGRKCRAEFVHVLEGSGTSDKGGVYVEGQEYRPDSYDPDICVECTHGVHFFITRKEAEEYN